MIEFANKYGHNVYSQNGEDGIIAECVRRLKIDRGHCVEIGGHDGFYCSNTARLIIDDVWSGLFVEADQNLYQQCVENWQGVSDVRVECARVDGENVNTFVDDYCDLFSTDTDGADFEIFKGLKARPKICIVEIDSSLPPDAVTFNGDGGASYKAMVEVGIDKGYFLLCHTGNLVFVRDDYRDLFPEIVGDGVSNSDLYFNRSWLKAEAA